MPGLGGAAGSHATNLAGIRVRLFDPEHQALETGFPSSFEMRVDGQPISGTKYVFKGKQTADQYRTDEGIICIVNGQAHGYLPRDFFRRKAVGLSYIADSLLILADCSDFENRAREDLFMASRDRLSRNPIRYSLEEELTAALRADPGLRELNTRRRQEQLAEALADDKPMAEALERILLASPTLADLFLEGKRITSPFRTKDVGKQDEFTGRRFPTYFKFENLEYGEDLRRDCHINRRCRIIFVTDANNDYFDRSVQSGEFRLMELTDEKPEEDYGNYSLNLQNGRAILNLTLPKGAAVASTFSFEAVLTDPSRVEPFRNCFELSILTGAEKTKGSAKRKKPPSKEDGKEQEAPSGIQLPEIKEVREDEYARFGFTERTALTVKFSGESEGKSDVYDFFVNMDNVYLKHELKYTRLEPELVQQQFKIGVVLLGLALIHSRKNNDRGNASETEPAIEVQVENITRAVAPILLPLIHTVSTLEQAID